MLPVSRIITTRPHFFTGSTTSQPSWAPHLMWAFGGDLRPRLKAEMLGQWSELSTDFITINVSFGVPDLGSLILAREKVRSCCSLCCSQPSGIQAGTPFGVRPWVGGRHSLQLLEGSLSCLSQTSVCLLQTQGGCRVGL